MCAVHHARDYTNPAAVENPLMNAGNGFFAKIRQPQQWTIASGVLADRPMMDETEKSALVIGASGGIGAAVSAELERRDWQVSRLSRREDGFDVTNPEGVARALERLETSFDLVFVAVGILTAEGSSPEKSLSAITADQMRQVFAVNTIGPALILRHAADLLPRDRRCVIATLSARVGSIGDNKIGGWYSYRASKAALNQIVHGAAIELRRSHKQAICVAMHPGTVETSFTSKYAGRHKTVPADEAAANLLAVIDGLSVSETGGFFDWKGERVEW